MAEPKIAQMIGNLLPSMLTRNISGKPSQLAISVPSIAPMKPSAIEAKHPPRSYPTIDCPIAPHIPDTSSNIKSDSIDIFLFPYFEHEEAREMPMSFAGQAE